MRILVTAESRHDATTEVAHAIAALLKRAAIDVDERRPEEVSDLAAYDGVVLGSAIYAGHWLKPAKDLVERTSTRMRALPVWLFSTGPLGVPPRPEGLPVDVAPILEQSGAREHRVFGGRLDKLELGFGEKALVRIVGAAEGGLSPMGRDRGLGRRYRIDAEGEYPHRGRSIVKTLVAEPRPTVRRRPPPPRRHLCGWPEALR